MSSIIETPKINYKDRHNNFNLKLEVVEDLINLYYLTNKNDHCVIAAISQYQALKIWSEAKTCKQIGVATSEIEAGTIICSTFEKRILN